MAEAAKARIIAGVICMLCGEWWLFCWGISLSLAAGYLFLGMVMEREERFASIFLLDQAGCPYYLSPPMYDVEEPQPSGSHLSGPRNQDKTGRRLCLSYNAPA